MMLSDCAVVNTSQSALQHHALIAIIHSKVKLFKKWTLLWTHFRGRKCLHATSQKHALSHAISLAVNYCLFSHGDVSYRFNGKNDNVMLEFLINFLFTS